MKNTFICVFCNQAFRSKPWLDMHAHYIHQLATIEAYINVIVSSMYAMGEINE